VFAASFAQNRRSIDSLNALPFDRKIANAAVLDAHYLKNAAAARELKYKTGEAMSYSNLSLVYYYQGKYNLQVENSLKAIRLFEELKMMDKLAYEYGGFGYSMKRRNMPQALFYMQKGKAIAENHKDTASLLSIYNNYGVLKEMTKQLDSALYFYRKGLQLKEAVRDSAGIPYSLNNIAGIYVMKKNFDEAERLYGAALQMRQRANDGVGIAENYTYFGDLYLAQENYAKALLFYSEALKKAREFNYIDLMRNSYKSISEVQERLGNDREALANFKLYEQYKDSLINIGMNSKIAELEVRFDTNNKEKMLAQHKNLLLEKEAESRQKNYVLMMLSVLSAFIALTGFLIYRQQKLKNRQQVQEHELKTAISQIETQNKLHEQRLSISRDLHDNIGAQLTFIISSVDNIKYAFDLKNTKLDRKLESISSFTKETIVELRDTIWAMNTNEITLESMMTRILNFIEKAQDAKENITFTCSIANGLNELSLSSVKGMNIYRTVQEAVNNAVKYSHAKAISVSMFPEDDQIGITVSDDGIGFDVASAQRGNGLSNMEKRIAEIGGEILLESEVSKGTQVKILFDSNKADAV
jgi:signal transduction histidine kinase